ncbi:MAG TPA: hypothetical protein VMB34_19945 [Acetobacteraceae bacterium]|nr:hypothetical protein [Acetobacteraceae bacterium]
MDDQERDERLTAERIAASEERSELRLENAMIRIEGSIARLADQQVVIREEIQHQRQELHQQRTDSRTQFHWIIGTVIAGILATGALLFAGFQIWGSGAQFGQAAQQYIQQEVRNALPPSAQPSATGHKP